MILLGHYNTMRVGSISHVGGSLYDLEAPDDHPILLPIKFVPKNIEAGDIIDVYIYKDSEDRVIATTQKPYLILGEFGLLKVKDVTKIGAFMDWGLDKDLLVPINQQRKDMEEGNSYVVYLYLDEKTQRLAASNKLKKFLNNDSLTVEEGDEVDLLVIGRGDLGVNVIVNSAHLGLVYNNEIFQELNVGDKLKGFVKKIREEETNKIDISLQKQGIENLESGAAKIHETLKNNKGILHLHDKSSPQEIAALLKMSKKNFKKSVGILYKNKIISLDENCIKLI